MPTPLSRERIRHIDRVAVDRYGMAGLTLMENAGRGAAEIIHRIAPPGVIVILCGKGNNSGDGYVIARHLDIVGRSVRIVSIVAPDELEGDALANAEIARKAEIPLCRVTDAEQFRDLVGQAATVVDCLLGTGASGPLRGLYGVATAAANVADVLRIAVDVPTGLDCDTGLATEDTFRADHTITFVCPKLGFQKDQAPSFVGTLHVVGIGVPRKLLDEFT